MLMKDGVELVQQHDLERLRHMCSVGEPLNPEAVLWGREAFGLDFHDTFWQTETGAIMITNLPGHAGQAGQHGTALPRRSRRRWSIQTTGEPITRDRAGRHDRHPPAVAQHDADLLEQHGHLLRASS